MAGDVSDVETPPASADAASRKLLQCLWAGQVQIGLRVDENSDKEQTWNPTHLQLTVLRACSLRPKGATGTSNPYVVIQLQKQKFRTCVAPHSLSPEWHEECTLQLPSVLDNSEEHALVLTVMHQSLHHFNQFLGRVSLPLAQLFQDKTKRKNVWFVLQSQPGKKEKARGKLQLDIQFLQILSHPSEPALNSSGPWSLFTRFYGSKKSRRYKAYKEAPSQSSSLTNEEDSSSSSMTTEPEASSLKSGPKSGSSLQLVTAASSGKKSTSKTQLKLMSCHYKELSPNVINLAADPSSQSEHPSTLEQFSSIFKQQPKKKLKPLKEERSPEAAGVSMETWQASLPSIPVAGPSDVPPRSKTIHVPTVNLQQLPTTSTSSSTSSHLYRCRTRMHRSYQLCCRCFGLSSSG